MTKRYIVYDIGTACTKAALVEGDKIVQAHIASYSTYQGDSGVMEQSAADWGTRGP